MAKQVMDLERLCNVLGIDRPSEVLRVVLDMRTGRIPTLYVERIADTEKILVGLAEPGIVVQPAAGPVQHCMWCGGDPLVRHHPDGFAHHRDP